MRRFLLLVAVGIVRRSLAARSRRTADEKKPPRGRFSCGGQFDYLLKTGGFFARAVPMRSRVEAFQTFNPPLVIVEARQALAPVGRAWVPVAEAFALPTRSGALRAVQSWPPHALGRCVRGLGRLPACVGMGCHSKGACGLSRAVLGALRIRGNSPASWL